MARLESIKSGLSFTRAHFDMVRQNSQMTALASSWENHAICQHYGPQEQICRRNTISVEIVCVGGCNKGIQQPEVKVILSSIMI